MSYNLFLDDIRNPEAMDYTGYGDFYRDTEWIVVRNYDEFLNILSSQGLPAMVSFDHDLADEHYRVSMFNNPTKYSGYYTDGTFTEKTGYDCAKYLCDYCVENTQELPKLFVHTMNPIGAENIINYWWRAYEEILKQLEVEREGSN